MGRRYRFSFKRLDVYRAAVEHFEWTCGVVQRMPKGPFVVVNQAVGASLSVMGNIGEANGRQKRPGEVEQHLRYAQGSTFESATHLDAFAALGVIDDADYDAEEDRLARIAAMLTRLMQRQRKLRRAPRRRPEPPRSGVEAAAAASIEPSPAEVPAGAKRPPGIEPRTSGRRP